MNNTNRDYWHDNLTQNGWTMTAHSLSSATYVSPFRDRIAVVDSTGINYYGRNAD